MLHLQTTSFLREVMFLLNVVVTTFLAVRKEAYAAMLWGSSARAHDKDVVGVPFNCEVRKQGIRSEAGPGQGQQ